MALGDGNYIAEPAYTTNAAGFAFHNWYGFGRVDVAAAVSMAKAMTPNNFGTFTETAYASSGTINLAIPDISTVGAVSTITDSNGLVIEAIKLRVVASHPWSGDLGVELTSPSGTRSVLFTIRNGFGRSDDLDFELLSNAFYGENSAGVWTIKVVDGEASDTGTLTSWLLQIYGH
ncbi:MAG: subtilisin-like proprotein convertase family protein [Planctomycetaceae bacterium]